MVLTYSFQIKDSETSENFIALPTLIQVKKKR